MNEVKTPKKPLAFYYMVVMLILLLFNFIALPQLVARSVKEVDYGKFMTMTKDKQIGEVQIQSDEIQAVKDSELLLCYILHQRKTFQFPPVT